MIERSDVIYEYLRTVLKPRGLLVQQVRCASEVSIVLAQWTPAAIVLDAALTDRMDGALQRVAVLGIPIFRCAVRSRDESPDTTALHGIADALLGSTA